MTAMLWSYGRSKKTGNIAMECIDFRRWLNSQDLFDVSKVQLAQEHAEACPFCGKLYLLDSQIEFGIKETLRKIDPPERLFKKIHMNVQSETGNEITKGGWWKILLPVFAVLVVFVIYFNPVNGKFESVEQVGTLAVKAHLSNLEMAFGAHEIADVPVWFEDKLGFRISIPNLLNEECQLAGGRSCNCRNNDVAYLCYESGDKKVSLYIIESGDVSFDVEEGREYSVSRGGCEVKIWKKENLLYAMVE